MELFLATAVKQPHEEFSGFASSLQHEWGYLQRVLELTVQMFDQFEVAIGDTLMPEMFDANIPPGEMHASTSLPIKYYGMGSLNLSMEAPLNWEASLDITTHTISEIFGEENFNPVLHAEVMSTV